MLDRVRPELSEARRPTRHSGIVKTANTMTQKGGLIPAGKRRKATDPAPSKTDACPDWPELRGKQGAESHNQHHHKSRKQIQVKMTGPASGPKSQALRHEKTTQYGYDFRISQANNRSLHPGTEAPEEQHDRQKHCNSRNEDPNR